MATFLDVVFEVWIYPDKQKYGIEAFQAKRVARVLFYPSELSENIILMTYLSQVPCITAHVYLPYYSLTKL